MSVENGEKAMQDPEFEIIEKTDPDAKDPREQEQPWPAKADPDVKEPEKPAEKRRKRRRKKLYKAEELALMLNISVSQIYALHATGKLKAYRLTTKEQGGLRFAAKHVAQLLEESERGGGAGLAHPESS